MPSTLETHEDFVNYGKRLAERFLAVKFDALLDKEIYGVIVQNGTFFASSRDPNGTPWPPLAPSTIRRKARAIAGPNAILIDTGRMVHSLGNLNGGDQVRYEYDFWPAKAGFVLGTFVPYSQYHQRGNARLPQRAHVGLSMDFCRDLAARCARYIRNKLEGKG